MKITRTKTESKRIKLTCIKIGGFFVNTHDSALYQRLSGVYCISGSIDKDVIKCYSYPDNIIEFNNDIMVFPVTVTEIKYKVD